MKGGAVRASAEELAKPDAAAVVRFTCPGLGTWESAQPLTAKP